MRTIRLALVGLVFLTPSLFSKSFKPLISSFKSATTLTQPMVENLRSLTIRPRLLPVQTTTGLTSSSIQTGYARLLPDSGATLPAGVAIFGFKSGGILVSEAAVPASSLIQSGRIFVDVGGAVNTGLAIANPNNQDAVISFYFTDSKGTDFGAGAVTLLANHQISAFLNDKPFNGLKTMQGTFTFSSSVPVAAIALRGLVNERGDFLTTTIPVSPVGGAFGGDAVVFPHFADGGWTTQIVLINPGNVPLAGTLQFWGQGRNGSPSPVKVFINGTNDSTFRYTIPPRSAVKMEAQKAQDNLQVASIKLIPAASNNAPSGLAIFSFKNRGVTVSTTSVSALPAGNSFRTYIESSGTFGQTGSIQTGLAISNSLTSSATVQLNLNKLDGTPTGISTSINIPAGGQTAKFLNELLPDLLSPFTGVLEITAASSVTVSSFRARYNERGDLLFTSMPPVNDASLPSNAEIDFPHIVTGGGYTTQLILLSSDEAESDGTIWLYSQDGNALPSVQILQLQ